MPTTTSTLTNILISSTPDFKLPSKSITIAALSGLAAVLTYKTLFSTKNKKRRKGLPLPPGPPGLPIVGNAWDVPAEEFWCKYKEWGDEYDSDIIHLTIYGTDVVVLNTLAACRELLEKRSAIYSSRPGMPMMNDFIGFDWHFGFIPYGEEWKQRRKVFAQAFGPKEVEQFRPTLLKVVRRFLLHILDDPAGFREHTRLLSGSFILSISYGLSISSPSDPYILQAEQGMSAMAAAGTGTSYIVDLIPGAKYLPSWLPGVRFKKDAAAWRPSVRAMAREPLRFAEEALREGNARPSLARDLLQELDEDDEEYEEKRKVIHDVLASIYAAGSDTTVSSISTFFLAMALNPSIQSKAQRIIDAALSEPSQSSDPHLPNFTLFKKLPYIEALVREILRWRPVTPIGVPHALTQDDVYNGYHIPGGATVVSNCYAIAHDPAIYGEGTGVFNPGRFMDREETEVRGDAPMGYETFGYGRRVCPGILSAVETVWVVVVSVLAVFEISVPDDCDSGRDHDEKREGEGEGGRGGKGKKDFGKYSSGMLIHPLPFDVKIVPRSREAEGLVRGGVAAAQDSD